MNTQNSDPGQDPNCNQNEDGKIPYKTQLQCQEDVQPLPQAMSVALDGFKERKENGPLVFTLVEDVQPVSTLLVEALERILPEWRRVIENPGTTCIDMCLFAGSAFAVRGVERGENAHGDSQEIWRIEDVVSNQVTLYQPPRAVLLPDNTDLNALLNTGIIPILEQTPGDLGMAKYRFSLASLADGLETPLYEWVWFTLPTFS